MLLGFLAELIDHILHGVVLLLEFLVPSFETLFFRSADEGLSDDIPSVCKDLPAQIDYPVLLRSPFGAGDDRIEAVVPALSELFAAPLVTLPG